MYVYYVLSCPRSPGPVPLMSVPILPCSVHFMRPLIEPHRARASRSHRCTPLAVDNTSRVGGSFFEFAQAASHVQSCSFSMHTRLLGPLWHPTHDAHSAFHSRCVASPSTVPPPLVCPLLAHSHAQTDTHSPSFVLGVCGSVFRPIV